MRGSIERHCESAFGQPTPSRRAQDELSDKYFVESQRAHETYVGPLTEEGRISLIEEHFKTNTSESLESFGES